MYMCFMVVMIGIHCVYVLRHTLEWLLAQRWPSKDVERYREISQRSTGWCTHYSDVIMSAMASQINGVSIVSSYSLFRCRSKKMLKLYVTDLWEENPPVTGGFSSQRSSNAEKVSLWLCHHDFTTYRWVCIRAEKGSTFSSGRVWRQRWRHQCSYYDRNHWQVHERIKLTI